MTASDLKLPCRGTWCEIDTDAFRVNLTYLRSRTRAQALLVVKANAYGHDALTCARVAQDCGFTMLGVATVNEAVQLREQGIDLPILVIATMTSDEMRYCMTHDIAILAWHKEHFALASSVHAETGVAPRLHLEIDTGMSRSGICVRDLVDLLETCTEMQRTYITGVMTHLYSAAPIESLSPTERAIAEYETALTLCSTYNIRGIHHAANSAAFLRLPHSHYDMARIGIIAYGLSASKFVETPSEITPVLSWKARITDIRTLEKNQGVSYGWQYVANDTHVIATLPVGYADGLHPFLRGEVLLHGQRTPILGRVCMDQVVIRVPDNVNAARGDEVVLIGTQGNQTITARELAELFGTNTHDLVSGINVRVPRVTREGNSYGSPTTKPVRH